MTIAVYPGSFDPVTVGHMDIIWRAAEIFDKLYVCVMVNSEKKPMFTLEERVDFIRRAVGERADIEVDSSDELLVSYVARRGANVIVKGLRAVSDFEAEFQMALINRQISPVDTVFLASDTKYTYLSSSMVKELGKYNVDLRDFIPEEILEDVEKRMRTRR